jgi:glycosyltransferase involved in cell wall biosynthesis
MTAASIPALDGKILAKASPPRPLPQGAALERKGRELHNFEVHSSPRDGLRLGFMLRNFGELGGIAVYTRELLEHLLKIDHQNEYYIFVGSRESLGMYADRPRVREIYVPCVSKFLWDQAQVAMHAKRLQIDVMFSPKMSSPLLFPGKKVFAIHGAEQFLFAKDYPFLDRLYVRTFVPLFAKTSDRVIAMTEKAKHDLAYSLGIPEDRIAVIYPGAKEAFRRRVSEDEKRAVREKYGLPESFILHVGLIWAAKNFGVFPSVLEELNREHSIVLAHAGEHRAWVRSESQSNGFIRELGFVPDETLAVLYQSALALVFPSLYEGFGIPLVEAMASGCPVVTTSWGAMKEVCEDAALLVDPRKPEEIAQAVKCILRNPGLREELIARGYERASHFSWEKTASETLSLLAGVGTKRS